MKPFKQVQRFLALGVAVTLFMTPLTVAQSADEVEQLENPFSYTYAQVGGGLLDTTGDEDGVVYEGRGLIALGELFYLRGEASQQDYDDLDTTITTLSGHVGVQRMLGQGIGVNFDVGYVNSTAEINNFDTEFDGPIVALGLRGFSPEKSFEGELRYSHRWFDDVNDESEDEGNLRADLIWRATDHIGVYVGANWQTDTRAEKVNTYALGLRYSL